MRFLICGINYLPELTGIGKFTGEMAEWLAAQGHDVYVITAPPYYPEWKLKSGYSARRYQYEKRSGVKVCRCPLWIPRKQSSSKRLLHLASFALSSLPLLLWKGLFWQPDVVFVVEPPFFCAPVAWLAACLAGAKSWLHIQDFEIDAGFDLGFLPNSSFLRNFVVGLERILMQRFDYVSTISEKMVERLATKGIDQSKRWLFQNWVDTTLIYPMSNPSPLRDELGIKPETTVALYAGNLGRKQGLELLIAAAKALESHSNILFVICGEGTAKQQLLELATGLSNVYFLNLQPLERLNALLNLANIHLLPQSADVADLVMPSKLKGMFASGRPVITTASPGTQIAQLVERHGVVVPPGDVAAFVRAILYLQARPQKCDQLGLTAREFAVKYWSQDKILNKVEQLLLENQREPNHRGKVTKKPNSVRSCEATIFTPNHPSREGNL